MKQKRPRELTVPVRGTQSRDNARRPARPTQANEPSAVALCFPSIDRVRGMRPPLRGMKLNVRRRCRRPVDTGADRDVAAFSCSLGSPADLVAISTVGIAMSVRGTQAGCEDRGRGTLGGQACSETSGRQALGSAALSPSES